MGSGSGALKTAAARIGVTPEEYTRRRAAGEKWCMGCRAWHPADRFATDRSRGDGLVPTCRDFRNAQCRAAYIPRQRVPSGRRTVPARDGDGHQARRRVNYLIEIGQIPPPNDVACMDCGHETGPGQIRHEYDHHRGYAADHHEDVEAVCSACHHRREHERRRAE